MTRRSSVQVFDEMLVQGMACRHQAPSHILNQCWPQWVNTLRPRRNGQNFADDILKRIFFDENVWISIKISLEFVPGGPINNIPALVQIMAWRRSGDKPLSETMMVSLPTHIWVTRPQWVNLVYYSTGIILSMGSATERWRHIVTAFPIGWLYTQNDSCSDITLSSWYFIPPTTQLFVQQFFQANIKEDIKTLHYWLSVRGIHQGPVDSPHKGPVMHVMSWHHHSEPTFPVWSRACPPSFAATAGAADFPTWPDSE